MAVTNVACPHCGSETLVTVPMYKDSQGKQQPKTLARVVQNHGYKEFGKTTMHAACQKCGGTFGALFS